MYVCVKLQNITYVIQNWKNTKKLHDIIQLLAPSCEFTLHTHQVLMLNKKSLWELEYGKKASFIRVVSRIFHRLHVANT